jgi:predicted TIM-barrel fold metal-dependent hydrolase
MSDTIPPEHNVTGQDYSKREHLVHAWPPLIDIHAHVTMTSAEDKKDGPAGGAGAAGSSDAAALMLDVAAAFDIQRTYSMCPSQDIRPLKERFGDRIAFNAMIAKKPDEPDDAAYRNLDEYLAAGIEIIKLWSAPRGRERGFFVDAPWRIEAVKRARAAGIRIVMVHVADPDLWWKTVYKDTAKYGSKADQYVPLKKMLEMFPDMDWIGAHMGGDPEHPDHLEELLVQYPHFHYDTSATKWQVREVSQRAEAVRSLICRFPDRFLFGSDLVTRHGLPREHYVSRYWCQRTLWESSWTGPSPIQDPDIEPGSPHLLRGLALPSDVLEKVYSTNACRLLRLGKL